ncbi:MAG: hypothetical protein EOM21_15965 [Gammaproteobacteria bacterium]|nr:hypothetical protein [Gammaproteobacteria bacterium]
MSFMIPTIHKTKDMFVIYESGMDQGPEFLSESDCPRLRPGIYTRDELLSYRSKLGHDATQGLIDFFRKHRDVDEVEIQESYWGWLSAPGYLDRSDVVLGDSRADVAQQLLDMFYDGDPEYMTDDEKAEAEWLQGIVDAEEMYV